MASLFDLLKRRFAGTPYTALSELAPNPDPLTADPKAYDAWKERLRTVHGDAPEYSKVPWNMSTINTYGKSPTSYDGWQDLPVHQTDAEGNKTARSWKEIYPMAGKPTVQYSKPSGGIAGGSKGGFKRVLKHLGAMESPGPDWSLEAKNVGVQSPWGISNAPWEALSPSRAWLERKKKEELA